MEQKDKLTELVNEVDLEAQKFGSFEEYLKAREAQNSPETREEWTKSVNAAVDSSSSSGSEKVAGTDESSSPSSAAPVSPQSEEEKPTPRAIPPKDELPRPQAAPVLPIEVEGTEPTPESLPFVITRLHIQETEWVSGGAFISEEQIAVPEPNGPNEIYLAGRKFAVTGASDEEVIEHFHKIEAYVYKAREFQKGLRSGLAERLNGQSSERRAKLKELDRDNRNKSALAHLKKDRATTKVGPSAPPKGAGIKLADAYNVMGDTAEEMCDKLKALGKLDEQTIAYIEKTYGKGAK